MYFYWNNTNNKKKNLEGFQLIYWDVLDLCQSMLHKKGIEALKRNLEEYPVTKIHWNDLINIAVLVLDNNNIEFCTN